MGSETDICGCILLVFALLGLAYLAANIADDNWRQKTNCTKKSISRCINKILNERPGNG
jgi:hypothetical protein